jgi:hypothetical protein
MIGSSARRHGPRRDGDVSGPPADQWDWHEVVPNERLSPAHARAESGWTWGHTWTVVRLSVLPFLVTAVALTTALLTLVGLVARPLPWSSAPVFGGSSVRQAAPAPTSPSSAHPVPLRTGAAQSPTSTAPREASSVAGAAASGTPVATSAAAGSAGPTRPAGPAAPASTSSGAPVLNLPLPPLPVSVSVSVSIPGPLPLPPVVITLP